MVKWGQSPIFPIFLQKIGKIGDCPHLTQQFGQFSQLTAFHVIAVGFVGKPPSVYRLAVAFECFDAGLILATEGLGELRQVLTA